MVRRTQIESMVKLFKFKKRGKNSYVLDIERQDMPTVRVFLYHFQDKPKGWKVDITNFTSQFHSTYLNTPLDLVTLLMHYSEVKTEKDLRGFFGDGLNELIRKKMKRKDHEEID